MTSGQLQLSQDFHGFNENAEPLYAVEVAASTKNGDTDYPAQDYTPSVSSPGEIAINSDQSDSKQYVTQEQELRAKQFNFMLILWWHSPKVVIQQHSKLNKEIH